MSDDRLKIIFGFCVLVILAILAAMSLIRHYDQADDIVGALILLAGGFVQWAFSQHKGDKDDKSVQNG